MIELITAGKIVLLVAVPTTLMLLYLLLRRHDDDEEDGKASQQTIATSRQTVLEIKVPRDVVSTIIGRQGITIKKIQECSGAKLHFWDEATGREEQDRVVVIRGSADAARHAEVMIQKIIADIPEVITEDFYIPNSATGRIIGKGGGNIRSILRTSKAKINIEKSDNRDSKQMRLVTITGSRKQIDVAKQMIEDEVQEMENAEKLHFGEPKEPGRQHRKDASKTDRCSDLSMRAAPRQENWDVDAGGDHIKKNILEVYVMTIKNPGHFWVHVAGSKLMQLKSLMENIGDFYSNLEDSMVYNVLDEVSEGDVIAAYLEDKNTWYRARITEVDGDCLTVFCLDYGYTITVSKSKLRRLKGEFLCLPFQAVECHLAEVTPKGGIWSDRACEMFGEHVHINQSTIISAEIIHYKRAPYGLVPCLRLTDYSDPAHIINVNKELVEQGFAEWIDKTFVGVEDASIVSQEMFSEGIAGTNDLQYDPFSMSPPENNGGQMETPPKDADWASDFPWAWAYNEEENASWSSAENDSNYIHDSSLSRKRPLQGEVGRAETEQFVSVKCGVVSTQIAEQTKHTGKDISTQLVASESQQNVNSAVSMNIDGHSEIKSNAAADSKQASGNIRQPLQASSTTEDKRPAALLIKEPFSQPSSVTTENSTNISVQGTYTCSMDAVSPDTETESYMTLDSGLPSYNPSMSEHTTDSELTLTCSEADTISDQEYLTSSDPELPLHSHRVKTDVSPCDMDSGVFDTASPDFHKPESASFVASVDQVQSGQAVSLNGSGEIRERDENAGVEVGETDPSNFINYRESTHKTLDGVRSEQLGLVSPAVDLQETLTEPTTIQLSTEIQGLESAMANLSLQDESERKSISLVPASELSHSFEDSYLPNNNETVEEKTLIISDSESLQRDEGDRQVKTKEKTRVCKTLRTVVNEQHSLSGAVEIFPGSLDVDVDIQVHGPVGTTAYTATPGQTLEFKTPVKQSEHDGGEVKSSLHGYGFDADHSAGAIIPVKTADAQADGYLNTPGHEVSQELRTARVSLNGKSNSTGEFLQTATTEGDLDELKSLEEARENSKVGDDVYTEYQGVKERKDKNSLLHASVTAPQQMIDESRVNPVETKTEESCHSLQKCDVLREGGKETNLSDGKERTKIESSLNYEEQPGNVGVLQMKPNKAEEQICLGGDVEREKKTLQQREITYGMETIYGAEKNSDMDNLMGTEDEFKTTSFSLRQENESVKVTEESKLSDQFLKSITLHDSKQMDYQQPDMRESNETSSSLSLIHGHVPSTDQAFATSVAELSKEMKERVPAEFNSLDRLNFYILSNAQEEISGATNCLSTEKIEDSQGHMAAEADESALFSDDYVNLEGKNIGAEASKKSESDDNDWSVDYQVEQESKDDKAVALMKSEDLYIFENQGIGWVNHDVAKNAALEQQTSSGVDVSCKNKKTANVGETSDDVWPQQHNSDHKILKDSSTEWQESFQPDKLSQCAVKPDDEGKQLASGKVCVKAEMLEPLQQIESEEQSTMLETESARPSARSSSQSSLAAIDSEKEPSDIEETKNEKEASKMVGNVKVESSEVWSRPDNDENLNDYFIERQESFLPEELHWRVVKPENEAKQAALAQTSAKSLLQSEMIESSAPENRNESVSDNKTEKEELYFVESDWEQLAGLGSQESKSEKAISLPDKESGNEEETKFLDAKIKKEPSDSPGREDVVVPAMPAAESEEEESLSAVESEEELSSGSERGGVAASPTAESEEEESTTESEEEESSPAAESEEEESLPSSERDDVPASTAAESEEESSPDTESDEERESLPDSERECVALWPAAESEEEESSPGSEREGVASWPAAESEEEESSPGSEREGVASWPAAESEEEESSPSSEREGVVLWPAAESEEEESSPGPEREGVASLPAAEIEQEEESLPGPEREGVASLPAAEIEEEEESLPGPEREGVASLPAAEIEEEEESLPGPEREGVASSPAAEIDEEEESLPGSEREGVALSSTAEIDEEEESLPGPEREGVASSPAAEIDEEEESLPGPERKGVASLPAAEIEEESLPGPERKGVASLPAAEIEEESLPGPERKGVASLPAAEIDEEEESLPGPEREGVASSSTAEIDEEEESLPGSEREGVASSSTAEIDEEEESLPGSEREGVASSSTAEIDEEEESLPGPEREGVASLPAAEIEQEEESLPGPERKGVASLPAAEIEQEESLPGPEREGVASSSTAEIEEEEESLPGPEREGVASLPAAEIEQEEESLPGSEREGVASSSTAEIEQEEESLPGPEREGVASLPAAEIEQEEESLPGSEREGVASSSTAEIEEEEESLPGPEREGVASLPAAESETKSQKLFEIDNWEVAVKHGKEGELFDTESAFYKMECDDIVPASVEIEFDKSKNKKQKVTPATVRECGFPVSPLLTDVSKDIREIICFTSDDQDLLRLEYKQDENGNKAGGAAIDALSLTEHKRDERSGQIMDLTEYQMAAEQTAENQSGGMELSSIDSGVIDLSSNEMAGAISGNFSSGVLEDASRERGELSLESCSSLMLIRNVADEDVHMRREQSGTPTLGACSDVMVQDSSFVLLPSESTPNDENVGETIKDQSFVRSDADMLHSESHGYFLEVKGEGFVDPDGGMQENGAVAEDCHVFDKPNGTNLRDKDSVYHESDALQLQQQTADDVKLVMEEMERTVDGVGLPRELIHRRAQGEDASEHFCHLAAENRSLTMTADGSEVWDFKDNSRTTLPCQSVSPSDRKRKPGDTHQGNTAVGDVEASGNRETVDLANRMADEDEVYTQFESLSIDGDKKEAAINEDEEVDGTCDKENKSRDDRTFEDYNYDSNDYSESSKDVILVLNEDDQIELLKTGEQQQKIVMKETKELDDVTHDVMEEEEAVLDVEQAPTCSKNSPEVSAEESTVFCLHLIDDNLSADAEEELATIQITDENKLAEDRPQTETGVELQATKRQAIEAEISSLLNEIITIAAEKTCLEESQLLSITDQTHDAELQLGIKTSKNGYAWTQDQAIKMDKNWGEILPAKKCVTEDAYAEMKASLETTEPEQGKMQNFDVLPNLQLEMAGEDLVTDHVTSSTEVTSHEQEVTFVHLLSEPHDSGVKDVEQEKAERVEQKLRNITTHYSTYVEQVPETQLLLKLETLYFIEKRNRDDGDSTVCTDSLPPLESVAENGYYTESRGEAGGDFQGEKPKSFTSVYIHANGDAATTTAVAHSDEQEIFANVLLVEIPSGEGSGFPGQSAFMTDSDRDSDQAVCNDLAVSQRQGRYTNTVTMDVTEDGVWETSSESIIVTPQKLEPVDNPLEKLDSHIFTNTVYVNVSEYEQNCKVEASFEPDNKEILRYSERTETFVDGEDVATISFCKSAEDHSSVIQYPVTYCSSFVTDSISNTTMHSNGYQELELEIDLVPKSHSDDSLMESDKDLGQDIKLRMASETSAVTSMAIPIEDNGQMLKTLVGDVAEDLKDSYSVEQEEVSAATDEAVVVGQVKAREDVTLEGSTLEFSLQVLKKLTEDLELNKTFFLQDEVPVKNSCENNVSLDKKSTDEKWVNEPLDVNSSFVPKCESTNWEVESSRLFTYSQVILKTGIIEPDVLSQRGHSERNYAQERLFAADDATRSLGSDQKAAVESDGVDEASLDSLPAMDFMVDTKYGSHTVDSVQDLCEELGRIPKSILEATTKELYARYEVIKGEITEEQDVAAAAVIEVDNSASGNLSEVQGPDDNDLPMSEIEMNLENLVTEEAEKIIADDQMQTTGDQQMERITTRLPLREIDLSQGKQTSATSQEEKIYSHDSSSSLTESDEEYDASSPLILHFGEFSNQDCHDQTDVMEVTNRRNTVAAEVGSSKSIRDGIMAILQDPGLDYEMGESFGPVAYMADQILQDPRSIEKGSGASALNQTEEKQPEHLHLPQNMKFSGPGMGKDSEMLGNVESHSEVSSLVDNSEDSFFLEQKEMERVEHEVPPEEAKAENLPQGILGDVEDNAGLKGIVGDAEDDIDIWEMFYTPVSEPDETCSGVDDRILLVKDTAKGGFQETEINERHSEEQNQLTAELDSQKMFSPLHDTMEESVEKVGNVREDSAEREFYKVVEPQPEVAQEALPSAVEMGEGTALKELRNKGVSEPEQEVTNDGSSLVEEQRQALADGYHQTTRQKKGEEEKADALTAPSSPEVGDDIGVRDGGRPSEISGETLRDPEFQKMGIDFSEQRSVLLDHGVIPDGELSEVVIREMDIIDTISDPETITVVVSPSMVIEEDSKIEEITPFVSETKEEVTEVQTLGFVSEVAPSEIELDNTNLSKDIDMSLEKELYQCEVKSVTVCSEKELSTSQDEPEIVEKEIDRKEDMYHPDPRTSLMLDISLADMQSELAHTSAFMEDKCYTNEMQFVDAEFSQGNLKTKTSKEFIGAAPAGNLDELVCSAQTVITQRESDNLVISCKPESENSEKLGGLFSVGEQSSVIQVLTSEAGEEIYKNQDPLMKLEQTEEPLPSKEFRTEFLKDNINTVEVTEELECVCGSQKVKQTALEPIPSMEFLQGSLDNIEKSASIQISQKTQVGVSEHNQIQREGILSDVEAPSSLDKIQISGTDFEEGRNLIVRCRQDVEENEAEIDRMEETLEKQPLPRIQFNIATSDTQSEIETVEQRKLLTNVSEMLPETGLAPVPALNALGEVAADGAVPKWEEQSAGRCLDTETEELSLDDSSKIDNGEKSEAELQDRDAERIDRDEWVGPLPQQHSGAHQEIASNSQSLRDGDWLTLNDRVKDVGELQQTQETGRESESTEGESERKTSWVIVEGHASVTKSTSETESQSGRILPEPESTGFKNFVQVTPTHQLDSKENAQPVMDTNDWKSSNPFLCQPVTTRQSDDSGLIDLGECSQHDTVKMTVEGKSSQTPAADNKTKKKKKKKVRKMAPVQFSDDGPPVPLSVGQSPCPLVEKCTADAKSALFSQPSHPVESGLKGHISATQPSDKTLQASSASGLVKVDLAASTKKKKRQTKKDKIGEPVKKDSKDDGSASQKLPETDVAASASKIKRQQKMQASLVSETVDAPASQNIPTSRQQPAEKPQIASLAGSESLGRKKKPKSHHAAGSSLRESCATHRDYMTTDSRPSTPEITLQTLRSVRRKKKKERKSYLALQETIQTLCSRSSSCDPVSRSGLSPNRETNSHKKKQSRTKTDPLSRAEGHSLRINLALLSTGTRTRKRRKKNIVSV